jgi:fructose transport system permease protein
MATASNSGTTRQIPWAMLGPWLALLAACTFFATQSDRFLTGQNLSLVLQQVMVVGVLAIGQTLIFRAAW